MAGSGAGWPEHYGPRSQNDNGPVRVHRTGPLDSSRRRAPLTARLFHDRKTNAAAMTVLFGEPLPALLGFLARGERSLHLGRAFHQLMEVHRTELAADDPEERAGLHGSLRLAELVHRIVRAARL